jgi:hypothetical protein
MADRRSIAIGVSMRSRAGQHVIRQIRRERIASLRKNASKLLIGFLVWLALGVIVVAAGRGERLGGETAKQYQLIGGVPMVLRAMDPFLSHPDVAQVVLVLPPEVIERLPKSGRATVVLLVQGDEEDQQWSQAAYQQFMRDDAPEDAVYDA